MALTIAPMIGNTVESIFGRDPPVCRTIFVFIDAGVSLDADRISFLCGLISISRFFERASFLFSNSLKIRSNTLNNSVGAFF